ncbi:MAG: hypothetical protein KKA54_20720 [Proteobacteria bacterium]|nr:hypothetical protein [Pseudomonadota bacterium]
MKDEYQNLISEFEEEIGVDALYLFGRELHFPIETIVTPIVVGLLGNYIASFLDVKNLAAKHSKSIRDLFDAFISKLKSRKQYSEEVKSLNAETRSLFKNTKPLSDEILNERFVDLMSEESPTRRLLKKIDIPENNIENLNTKLLMVVLKYLKGGGIK